MDNDDMPGRTRNESNEFPPETLTRRIPRRLAEFAETMKDLPKPPGV